MRVGDRIRLARQRVGLNQRELAALTGLSQATISRVEAGARSALTVTELHRIATATGTTVTALRKDTDRRDRMLTAARLTGAVDPVVGSAGSPAVGSAGGDPPDSIAVTAAADLLELDAVLDGLSVPGRQVRRTPGIAFDGRVKAAEQGSAAAAGIRELCGFGFGPLAEVDELIEQVTGVDVVHRELGAVSGFCAVDPDRGTAIVLVNTADTAERQRFTAAHELAHLVFPGDPRHRSSQGPRRPPAEVRADEFARHLLIPLDAVSAWLAANDVAEVTESDLAALANVFRVSPEVAFIQLRELGRPPVGMDQGDLPTGRRLAYRHGWGPAYDLAQAVARAGRPSVRLVDRATRAYQTGKLGLPPLASLLGQSLGQARSSLSEAGVVPPQRRGDETLAAALTGHLMAGLSPDADARAVAREVVDGDLTADQAVERLRADLRPGG